MVAVSIKIVLATILELGTCPGYVIVFDVQGFGIGHLLSMHISILRKFFFFLQVNHFLKYLVKYFFQVLFLTENLP